MKHKSFPLIFVLLVALILSATFVVIKWQQNKAQQWTDKNFVVLLTMAIDPQGTIETRRSDIDDRITDYRQSLSRWAELPYRVVVVESSGYGNPFTDILANAPNITYVSKRLPHIPERGKGYGEAHIIRYAIENYFADYDGYIMKVTGRYAPVADLKPITKLLQAKHPEAMLRNRRHHSRWYVARRDFNLELADSCIATCDEKKGPDFDLDEHLFQISNKYSSVLRVNFAIDVLPTFRGGANDPAYQM